MMNAMQAKKMMKEDCQAYMISVQEIKEDGPRLEEIPIVREYPEVFPEELPGLPPSRELDFGIELVAGTQPISKAPYRMAPAEMAELKEQLEDLMEKNFIRPTIHPGEHRSYS